MLPQSDHSVTPFDFEGAQVRVAIGDDGEPRFVAADVCRVLELPNVSQALSRLQDGETGDIIFSDVTGRPQPTRVVNESGLYRLIFRSSKPEAERLRVLVFKHILPSIRKTGSYSVQQAKPMTPSELILMQAQRLVDMERKQAEHDARITALETARTEDRLALGDGAERFYSVLGYASVRGMAALDTYTAARYGKRATAICRSRGLPFRDLPDPRFGKVNIYPESVLLEVFAV